nr:uncharacterized protein LOC111509191 isoform X1 [Leptinotarsa decemlineata]
MGIHSLHYTSSVLGRKTNLSDTYNVFVQNILFSKAQTLGKGRNCNKFDGTFISSSLWSTPASLVVPFPETNLSASTDRVNLLLPVQMGIHSLHYTPSVLGRKTNLSDMYNVFVQKILFSEILVILLLTSVMVQNLGAHVHNHLCKRDALEDDEASNRKNKINIVVTVKNAQHDNCQETTQTTTPTSNTTCQETTTESFTCVKPGSYPNPDNCTDFFICHKNGAIPGLERVKMSCPSGQAFDYKEHKCTPGAAISCLSQKSLSLS